MFWKNLKITAKLASSAVFFLLPLGIMLYFIISASVVSIRKNTKELDGIKVLRPAMALLQSIPQYTRMSLDSAEGAPDSYKSYIDGLFEEFEGNYAKYLGAEYYTFSVQKLKRNWEYISGYNGAGLLDNYLWLYGELITDIAGIINFAGDITGLITDSDIESAYLISASVYELVQAQERMANIQNLLRTMQAGAFAEELRSDLELNLDILVYSDIARIQNRYNAIERIDAFNTEDIETFKLLLNNCRERFTYFANAVREIIGRQEIGINLIPTLIGISIDAGNTAYRLQIATNDKLETIISARIASYRRQLIVSLAVAGAAAAFAFAIIFTTTFGIRKSTNIMAGVFKRLNENDLTVNAKTPSNDELGIFMNGLSDFLEKLKNSFASFNKNAGLVSTSIVELSSSAKEITATANEQSSSIAEIVSTMENNKNLSAEASIKTSEVQQLADLTRELSGRGAELRDFNENMMLDIRNQNEKIINIINNLVAILSRIDESVQLIDSFADNTKLIAFNATLEASSAGAEGARFSVVAGEIRRFAGNVAESVNEIKEKIIELKDVSQSLITEAESGSRAIDSGYNRMVEQKEVFENIVSASRNVAENSKSITDLSKRQEHASAQVFLVLKEISMGISQFVRATSVTSSAVDRLNEMSEELKNTLSQYKILDGENL